MRGDHDQLLLVVECNMQARISAFAQAISNGKNSLNPGVAGYCDDACGDTFFDEITGCSVGCRKMQAGKPPCQHPIHFLRERSLKIERAQARFYMRDLDTRVER